MSFLYQKTVDRSMLREGITIPKSLHAVLHSSPGGPITRGTSRKATIIVQGEKFEVTLKNQMFDTNKYARHSEVIQFRYGLKSPLVLRFRQIFNETWLYVQQKKQLPANRKRKLNIRTPEPIREYLILRSTMFADVFVADCITSTTKALTYVRDDSSVPHASPSPDDLASKADLTRLSATVDHLSNMLMNQQASIEKISQPMVIQVNSANIDVASLVGVNHNSPVTPPVATRQPDFSQVSKEQFMMACLQLDRLRYGYHGKEDWLMLEQKDWYYVGRIASETGYFGPNYQTALSKLLRSAVLNNANGQKQTIRRIPSNSDLSKENALFAQPNSRFYEPERTWHTITSRFDQNALAKATHIATSFVSILQQLLTTES